MLKVLRYSFLCMLLVTLALFVIYTFFPGVIDTAAGFWESNTNSSFFDTSGAFSCGSQWAKRYKAFHAKSLKSRDRKFMVYYCSGRDTGCGGYGNRLLGLVSVFYLSVLMNRTFLIHWGGPENFQDYFRPNQINWIYDKTRIAGLSARSTYFGVNSVPDYDRYSALKMKDFHNWVQKTRMEHYFDRPVEKIGVIWYFANILRNNPHLNKLARDAGIPEPRDEFPYGMLGCAMQFLFKKSLALQREYSKAYEAFGSRPRPILGIHIRTSDHHFGSFNDFSYRTRNPRRVFACARQVEAIIKRKGLVTQKQAVTWFLAADDVKLKRQALKDYPDHVITLDIEPRHLEYSNSADAVFMDLLVDFLLLLECDYFIGTRMSTYSSAVLGTRQFSTQSFVYGEPCELNQNALELSSPPHKT
ncbi:uncharacterized protein LOC116603645 [Nematostella vectensis]|uniref:uncharacterized protein LOC116603645 n=1 Tax=Nematostella vectensis TaxID=45351 RepID=UPI00138FF6B1|nr:uncharacterized protein LOC116603645 [Nematostella vectensis]XP_048575329.1 uncharacterized protein LOC116603645 [Nematostella vectensis]